MCSFFVNGGQLLSCGFETRLSRGLLGLGGIDADSDAVTKLTPLLSMKAVRVNSVSTEFGHGSAVTVNGDVYTWGSRHVGRLGDDGRDPPSLPMQVMNLAAFRIMSVSTGCNHCLAVAVTGQVFSWGIMIDGLCGHGNCQNYQPLPRQIMSLSRTRVRSASAGTLHSLVVTEDGFLFSFGRGFEGQLGHRKSDVVLIPKKIRALNRVRITSAAAGGFNSLALASDGTVFSWGSDEYGETGINVPHTVNELKGIYVKSIVVHGEGRCAVSAMGELYTWGKRPAGLLGHGSEVCHQPSPRLVDALVLEFVEFVSFGSMHTIVVTRSGAVFGWGSAKMFGLDVGDMGPIRAASMVRYTHISCAR
jgi:alpha-tubulin suppressor-like RCC1 family protein